MELICSGTINGVPIDCDDPNTFVGDPEISILVPASLVPDQADPIDPGLDNCPTIQVVVFNEVLGQWEPASSVTRDPATDVVDGDGNIILCEYIVTHIHWSKFSVGGVKKPTGTSGGGSSSSAGFAFGDPTQSNYDNQPPTFGEVLVLPGSIKIVAEINDNVAVKDAHIVVHTTTLPMQPKAGSANLWEGVIPTDLASGTVSFKIVARDHNKNVGEYSGTATSFGAAKSFSVSPSGAFGHQPNPAYSISAAVTKDNANIPAQITIKNTSEELLWNVRLMLSPELKGKMMLSDYSIRSIAPASSVTVSLMLVGNPNVDAMNNPIPYEGDVIISVNNRTPYVLNLSGDISSESSSLQSLFMKMLTSKGEERYKNKSFAVEKPDERISENAKYQVKLSSGASIIKNANDEIIITNNGDKPLRNIHIITSSLSDYFLPDQKNIKVLPAGAFMAVKLVSKMPDDANNNNNAYNAYSPTALRGELLVVPENGPAVTVPIDIAKRMQQDKNELYEVTTLSGNSEITNTADSIVIRNNSDEPINNVRLIVPRELAAFELDHYSFDTIEPHSGKIIKIQPRGTLDAKVKQVIRDYTGDITIISQHGMKKTIHMNMIWKGISSEHFIIYARDRSDELMKAVQVLGFLERNYSEVTKMVNGRNGNANVKTVIYMTPSMEELEMLSGALAPSTYVYGSDVGFVWSESYDVNTLALREFVHKTILQNYPSYFEKQKIVADKGNWIVDGISNYVAAKIVGERGMIKEQIDAFVAELELEPTTPFEWYGIPTEAEYGSSYTLYKYLNEKYGDSIIDKILQYLGSGMISNHRCDTFEQCALLRAVYDANGLDINNKRHELSFKKIVQEWKEYVHAKYSVSEEITKEVQ
jgi:hypothetical protein